MRVMLLALIAAAALATAGVGRSTPPPPSYTGAFHYVGTSLGGERFTTSGGPLDVVFEFDRGGVLRGSYAFVLNSQWAVLARVTPQRTLMPVQALPQPGQTAAQPDLTQIDLVNIHSLTNVQQVAFKSFLPDLATGTTFIFTKEGRVPYLVSNLETQAGQTIASSAATELSPRDAKLYQVNADATSEAIVAKEKQLELTKYLDQAISHLDDAIAQEKAVHVYLLDGRLKKADERLRDRIPLITALTSVTHATSYYSDTATKTTLAPQERALDEAHQLDIGVQVEINGAIVTSQKISRKALDQLTEALKLKESALATIERLRTAIDAGK